jgi:hypothetical protein
MPLITEPIKEVRDVVLQQVDQPDMFKLGGNNSDVIFLLLIGVALFFFSKFISLITKIIGLIIIMLCVYTLLVA